MCDMSITNVMSKYNMQGRLPSQAWTDLGCSILGLGKWISRAST